MSKPVGTYSFGIDVGDDFDSVVDRVTTALAEEGFGVLSDIDVRATLEAKLGIDCGDYRILGACNPPLANEAITAEPNIGVLLPCNVVVRRDDGTVRVEFMDPAAVMDLVDRPDVAALATEVRQKLERVRASL